MCRGHDVGVVRGRATAARPRPPGGCPDGAARTGRVPRDTWNVTPPVRAPVPEVPQSLSAAGHSRQGARRPPNRGSPAVLTDGPDRSRQLAGQRRSGSTTNGKAGQDRRVSAAGDTGTAGGRKGHTVVDVGGSWWVRACRRRPGRSGRARPAAHQGHARLALVPGRWRACLGAVPGRGMAPAGVHARRARPGDPVLAHRAVRGGGDLGGDQAPSPADALYLIGYPLIAAGLLVLVRARSRGRERTALTDALIITIGIGLVAWDLILKPSVSDETLSLAGTLISVAYPLMDLLLLATAVRLAVGRARSTAALVLLLTGLFSQLVADTVY